MIEPTYYNLWQSSGLANRLVDSLFINVTFHCFRHTFAMQLLDKGVDIYTITALLGHRQVSSTQNYAKITPKKVLEAIMKIG